MPRPIEAVRYAAFALQFATDADYMTALRAAWSIDPAAQRAKGQRVRDPVEIIAAMSPAERMVLVGAQYGHVRRHRLVGHSAATASQLCNTNR